MVSSCIALTGASATFEAWSNRKAPWPANDGVLTAEEFAELNLNGTALVTLSACRTGLGNSGYGSAVIGFKKAIFAAGAENVLLSLWDISDSGTVKFMSEFYQEYASGMRPADAFTKVQRRLLQGGGSVLDRVSIFGAFVLTQGVGFN
jgi:CHAT domain-containing protein